MSNLAQIFKLQYVSYWSRNYRYVEQTYDIMLFNTNQPEKDNGPDVRGTVAMLQEVQ